MKRSTVFLAVALCAITLPITTIARFWPPTGDLLDSVSAPSLPLSATVNGVSAPGNTVTMHAGDTIVISGTPQNLNGSYNADFTRAWFFDPVFNSSCSTNGGENPHGVWTMTCKPTTTGTSNTYVEIYTTADHGTYRSNTIVIRVDPAASAGIPDLQIRNATFSTTNDIGERDVVTINLCNTGERKHVISENGSISFKVTLNGRSDNMVPRGGNEDLDARKCRLMEIPNLLSGFSPFNHTNVPAGTYTLTLDLQSRDSTQQHFATTIRVENVDYSTVHAEDLQLWGSSTEKFFLLPVGKSIVLTGARSELSPVLEGFKTDQLTCRSVPTNYQGSENGNAKWECTALKAGNSSNSEVFFMIGTQRSNSIVIQVESATSSSSASIPAVTGVRFSPDFDVATVRFSAPTGQDYILRGHVYNEIYSGIGDGILARTSVGVRPGSSTVTTMESFRKIFEVNGGAGTEYEIIFALCRQDSDTSIDGNCGAPYVVDVKFEKSSASSSSRSSLPPLGGDRDAHGCIPSAGYSWCAAKQKCLRTWEESCPPPQSLPVCGFIDPQGKVQCKEMSGNACKEKYGMGYDSLEQCRKYSNISSSSSPTSGGKIPPAGYEDEVLTNFDAYTNPFPDTDMNGLGGKAAAELYRRAVIGGFPDGQFKGDRPVNRAEAAKFLILARFAAEQSGTNAVANFTNDGRFPDVLEGQWYTRYVIAAAKKGIINGNPDGTFRPANQVNTAEFLKMLSLTFNLQLNLPHDYEDVAPGDWFAPYAGIAQKYDLFPDRAYKLVPGSELTREEVAVAIYQYLSQR